MSWKHKERSNCECNKGYFVEGLTLAFNTIWFQQYETRNTMRRKSTEAATRIL